MQVEQAPGVRREVADGEDTGTNATCESRDVKPERERDTDIQRDVASVQNILIKAHNKP